MSLVIRIRAWPRIAATGSIALVCLAGGNNDAPHYDGQHYMAGVIADPRFEMSVSFGDDGWAARAVPQVGAIGWAPAEPERLDPLAAYYWRDAAIEIERIRDGVTTRRLTGTVAEAAISEGRLVITCADLSNRLDKPFVTATFAGTGGIEGGDFATGRVKRRSFGRVWNVEGRLLDKANSIYEFGDPAFPLQGCTALRDKGRAGPLGILGWQGSVAATLAALQASEPSQGGGIFAPSIACAKWWTQPAGPLTADLLGEADGYAETVAGIAAQLLARADGPVISNLAAAQALRPGAAGLHIGDNSETAAGALDRLFQRVTLIWTVTTGGQIEVRPWTFSTPVETLKAEFISRERTVKPVKTRQVGYKKNERQHGDGEISIAIQADDVVYADGTTGEELKPAERGATKGMTPEERGELDQVKDSTTAPSISLSRSTVTLWAYENGIVTDFSNASGLLKVISAGNDVTADATLSATATGCTGTINTAANTPVAGQPKGYYRVTAMPGDSAKLTLTAVYGGKTVTAEFQLTKIRAGYEIVASTLPTTNLFEGRLVYRESDGKLYRYKGGAWTAAISGADIDNATLTTAKFAAGIEPVTIVTGGSLPTTKSTNTIFYSGKLYRWNGSAYVATVQAEEVTGKITSTQIDDNSIQTPHLAAGAVIASKMSIIPNNMCADPFFEDMSYWNYRVDQQGAWSYLDETGWASVAMNVPRAINIGGPRSERIHIGTGLQKCDSQGETFWLRAHGRNSTPSDGSGTILRCAVWFYGGDPLAIIGQAQVDFSPGTPNAGEIRSTKFTFPANCIYYRIVAYSGAAWAVTGNLSISAIRLQKAADASLIVEGAVLAEHLGADSVIAGKVAAAAIGTRELVAKAATIEKLAIGSGSNIIPNSNFDTLDGWGDYGPTGYSVQLYRGSVGYGIRIIKGSGTGEAGVRMAGWGSADSKYYLPVNPGETYRVKCTVWRSAGNPAGNVGLYGRVLLQDGTSVGTQIGGIVANPAQATAYDVSGTYTIPANAVGIQFQIYYGSHADSAGGNVIVSNMSVTRMAAGELIIDGNVLAQHLGAGSVITDKLGAGAVTAAKISVTQLSAITATIGTLRTATSGARTEIKDNLIEMFYSNNVRAGRMGVW